MATLYEIQHVRQLDMKSWRYWEGLRTFICQAAYAASTAENLYGSGFPAGGLGDDVPTCFKTRIVYRPEGVRGVARIMAYYKTPMVPGRTIVRERIITNIKKATNEILEHATTTGSRPYNKKEREADPTPDEGIICEGPGNFPMQEWRIVRGHNLRMDTFSEIEVETAVSAPDYNLLHDNLWELTDKVNSDPFNIRGYISPGDLLFRGIESEDSYHQDPIPVRYKFWYNPWGWNWQCYKQPGVWAVWEMESHKVTGMPDEDGNIEISKSESSPKFVKSFIPGYSYQATEDQAPDGSPIPGPTIPVKDTKSRRVILFYEAPFADVIPGTESW